ncbi:MAG: hypothetical protein N3C61_03315, partial [Candidatus Micrarchaeota archaeon]|nr:hypothetical protein [Candidatus Micrarchaeota archaeon]
TWEKKLMEQFETIDCSWVSQHQKEIVLFSTYYDMLEVLDVDPAPGSIFIYSESEPWDEEGEIEFGKLENWLETLGLPLFHVHASGHAGPVELKGIVERVNPKKVIVVHSERPKLLRKFIGIGEFVCPKRGIPIELS